MLISSVFLMPDADMNKVKSVMFETCHFIFAYFTLFTYYLSLLIFRWTCAFPKVLLSKIQNPQTGCRKQL